MPFAVNRLEIFRDEADRAAGADAGCPAPNGWELVRVRNASLREAENPVLQIWLFNSQVLAGFLHPFEAAGEDVLL